MLILERGPDFDGYTKFCSHHPRKKILSKVWEQTIPWSDMEWAEFIKRIVATLGFHSQSAILDSNGQISPPCASMSWWHKFTDHRRGDSVMHWGDQPQRVLLAAVPVFHHPSLGGPRWHPGWSTTPASLPRAAPLSCRSCWATSPRPRCPAEGPP